MTAGGTSTRTHVRWAQNTYDTSPTYGTYSLATPHYETYNYGPDCFGGHAASSPNGYLIARTTLHNAMLTGGHPLVTSGDWGNNKMIKQCDNEYAGSDGIVLYHGI